MNDNFIPKDIPEGINTSKENPLRDLGEMMLIIGLALGGVFFLLTIGSNYMATNISFHQEQELFNGIEAEFRRSKKDDEKLEPEIMAIQNSMQGLVNELWEPYNDQEQKVKLPVTVTRDKVSNAFMGVGGNMSLTQGFLREAQSENELAFVICHEIGHFYHRHILKSLGQALGMQLVLSVIGLDGKGPELLGWGVGFAQQSHGREAESEADRLGLECMQKKYGHVNGADAFFRRAADKHPEVPGEKILSYFSTHPMSEDRIMAMSNLADARSWSQEGIITEVPYDRDVLPKSYDELKKGLKDMVQDMQDIIKKEKEKNR